MFTTIKNIKKFNDFVAKIENLANIVTNLLAKFESLRTILEQHADEIKQIKASIIGNKESTN